MAKIRIYDMYCSFSLSKNNRIGGTYNSWAEAEIAAQQWEIETDGECDIWACLFNEEAQKFLLIDAHPYMFKSLLYE